MVARQFSVRSVTVWLRLLSSISKMVTNSLTLIVGILVICTVSGQSLNNGGSSFSKQLAGVQPPSAQLPWTPVTAKMTRKVANSIGGDESIAQYRHYKRRPLGEDDDDQYRDRDYDSSSSSLSNSASAARKLPAGVSGPVHTYIKTDKNANFKWGVRHFAGRRYRG